MQFIKKYKTPPEYCDLIIKYFYDNEDKWSIGRIGQSEKDVGVTIDKSIKDSTDLCMKEMPDILKPYFDHLIDCVQQYSDEFTTLRRSEGLVIGESVNIQRYFPGGGFKLWHTERLPTNAVSIENDQSIQRVLVFMTYLNNAKDSGTDFKYQKTSFDCIKGDTLIWPADFTHTHRGQPTKEKKYIITGWMHYGR